MLMKITVAFTHSPFVRCVLWTPCQHLLRGLTSSSTRVGKDRMGEDQVLLPRSAGHRFPELHKQRFWLITLALLQNMLAGGIFYGWSALSAMLINNGVFANECQGGSLPCQDQNRHLHLIYTYAQSANLLGSLAAGFLLDYFGPRKCSVISLLGVSGGMLLLALSSSYNQYLLPGITLIGFFGSGVQIALFHLSNIFDENATTVMSLIAGAFNLSFLVFLCFRAFNDAMGISLFAICVCYTALLLVLASLSAMFWPDSPLEGNDHHANIEDGAEQVSYLQSAKTIVFSPKFLLLLFWMATSTFWANYYIGTVIDQLGAIFDPETSKSLSYLFNILLPLGTVGLPLYGRISRLGFSWIFLMACVSAVIYSSLSNIHSEAAQVGTFISYTVFRTIVFAALFVFVGSEWGFRYFGLLTGILFVAAAVVGLLQYPLVRLFNANYTSINTLQTVTLALSTLFPLYLRWTERRAVANHEMMVVPLLISSPTDSLGGNDDESSIKVPC